MGSMSDFFVKERANEGVKIDLTYPDGSKSGEWVVIKSQHSDDFLRKNAEVKRQVMANIALGKEFDEQKENNKLIACLIKDWSFDEELTEQSAVKFLTNAPQIADKINSLAADSKLFYEKKQER